MFGRATVALVLGLAGLAAFPACNRDVDADPALAAAGVSIPMGAVGAVGVGFDAPPAPASEGVAPSPSPRRKGDGKRRHLPPDPFADPPDTSGNSGNDGGAAPSAHPRHAGGTAL